MNEEKDLNNLEEGETSESAERTVGDGREASAFDTVGQSEVEASVTEVPEASGDVSEKAASEDSIGVKMAEALPNRARELNDRLFDYDKKQKTDASDDIFGASELKKPSPVSGLWRRVLAGALCVIAGFFGAVAGIFVLSQTGFVDNNSMLGNLIIGSSGLDVHKVTVNETDLNYSGGYIEVSENAVKSVVEVIELTSDGDGGFIPHGNASGVIISEDGYIVTNEHVTNGMDNLRVKLHDGSEYIAEIIGEDAESDIAVVKISLPFGVKLTPAPFGVSANVKYGQRVLVVGNPVGVGITVSSGIVSCPDRVVDSNGEMMSAIQTDAAVSPGNSGGGMFDVYGNLIGVICSKTTGNAVEGIGYAVPVDTAKKVVNDILTYGYVKGRAAIGITVASVLDKSSYDYWLANDLNGYLYDYRFGIYITSTMRSNELKRGDRVLEIDGRAVSSSAVITEYIKTRKPGDVVTLKIERLTPEKNDGSAVYIFEMDIELYERDW